MVPPLPPSFNATTRIAYTASRPAKPASGLMVGEPMVPPPTPSFSVTTGTAQTASRPAKPASGGHARRLAEKAPHSTTCGCLTRQVVHLAQVGA